MYVFIIVTVLVRKSSVKIYVHCIFLWHNPSAFQLQPNVGEFYLVCNLLTFSRNINSFKRTMHAVFAIRLAPYYTQSHLNAAWLMYFRNYLCAILNCSASLISVHEHSKVSHINAMKCICEEKSLILKWLSAVEIGVSTMNE